MAHVKFIVLPAPTYSSGPPSIVAVGTTIKNDHFLFLSLFLSLTVFPSVVFSDTFVLLHENSPKYILSEMIFVERGERECFADSRELTSRGFSSRPKVIVIGITRPSSTDIALYEIRCRLDVFIKRSRDTSASLICKMFREQLTTEGE